MGANRHLGDAQRLAHVGSWRWDVKQNIYYCSDELYRVFGFEPGEIEPTFEAFLNIVHPDDRERVMAIRQMTFGEAGRYTVEYRVVLPSGQLRWIEARAEEIPDEDGTLVEIAGVAQDVTARHLREDSAKERLARSQRDKARTLALLETLQTEAPIGCGFIDTDFRVVHVNETMAAVNGGSVDDQLGRTVAECVPELWPQLEPIYRHLRHTAVSVLINEAGMRAEDVQRVVGHADLKTTQAYRAVDDEPANQAAAAFDSILG